MSKLFAIPMDVIMSAASKIKLDKTAKPAVDAVKAIMNTEEFKFLAVLALELLDPEKQEDLIQGCTSQQFNINCRDEINVSNHQCVDIQSLLHAVVSETTSLPLHFEIYQW